MQPLDPVIEQIQDLMRNYEVLRRKGDKVGAQRVIEQIESQFPDHPNTKEARADWLRDEGRIGEARAIYKELIDEYSGRVATEKKYADLVFANEGQTAEIRQMLEAEKFSNILAPPGTVRNPNTSAVLSLILPGLGQVYNGELTRGLSFLGWSAISWLVFLMFGHVPGRPTITGIGFLALASIGIASIAAILDAFTGAPRGADFSKVEKKERPKPPVDLPFE